MRYRKKNENNLHKREIYDIMENLGGIPERSKGPDCKSGGSAFAGSNPAPSTPPAEDFPPEIAINKMICQTTPTKTSFELLRQPPFGGCSSMVERKPSKLDVRVRFPSPAPIFGARPRSSAVEHSLGKGEVAGSSPAVGTGLSVLPCAAETGVFADCGNDFDGGWMPQGGANSRFFAKTCQTTFIKE